MFSLAMFQDKLNNKHPFFWIILAIGTIVLALNIFIGVRIIKYGSVDRFGWSSFCPSSECFVGRVDPDSPAAGKLMVEDQIIAINGDSRIKNGAVILNWGSILNLKLSTVKETYSIRIIRDSKEQEFIINTTNKTNYKILKDFISYLPLGLAFILIAVIIGVLKPEQKIAQITSIALITYSISLLSDVIFQTYLTGTVSFITYAFVNSLNPIDLAIFYHFLSVFPFGNTSKTLWTFFRTFLYGLSLILFIGFRFFDLIIIWNIDKALTIFSGNNLITVLLSKANIAFGIICLGLFVSVLIRNFIKINSLEDRKKLDLVVLSFFISFAPKMFWSLFFFVEDFFKLDQQNKIIWLEALYINILPIIYWLQVTIPIAIGYCVLKHRIFGIDFVIRRSLQYFFAKNTLKTISVLPIIAFFLSIYKDRNLSMGDAFSQNSIYLYLLVAGGISLKYHTQVREWIDKQFFREAYNQEKILSDLIFEIKQKDSVSEISKLISNQLELTLHPKSLQVFYRKEENQNLTLDYSLTGIVKTSSIEQNSELLKIMENQEKALDYPFDKNLPKNEKDWLEELGVILIVPMKATDHHLIGLLLLGEKKSEEPYSSTDKKLLQAIANQVAFVYENALLKGRVGKEQKIKREVLARFEEQHINLVKECPLCGTCYDSSDEFCSKDNRELTMSLPVERIIEDKYRLEKLIGKGGMGAVYKATDMRLNRSVAIKIMLGSMFGDQEALRRFEREARASARLTHPNIIAIYDYGTLQSDGAYLVMELVNGDSLRSILKKSGSLKPEVIVQYFDQLLEGVKAAHKAGIIHRDLKPENVLITQTDDGKPRVKVLDFGLAKVKKQNTSENSSITAPGTVMGTFGYMPFEQLSGKEVDERCDIFALGVMVVEALTGKRPFTGKFYADMMNSLSQDDYRLEGDTESITHLDTVLYKCLAKEVNNRFSTIEEMQQEIIPAISNYSNIDPIAPSDLESRTIKDNVEKNTPPSSQSTENSFEELPTRLKE